MLYYVICPTFSPFLQPHLSFSLPTTLLLPPLSPRPSQTSKINNNYNNHHGPHNDDIHKAAWSVVFAQELLVVSAILLCVIAFSLFMAVVSLSEIQIEEGITACTLPYWGVYFPIGLHGGWTLAGRWKWAERRQSYSTSCTTRRCLKHSLIMFRCSHEGSHAGVALKPNFKKVHFVEKIHPPNAIFGTI